MKILAGVQPRIHGDYFIDGKKVEFKNVRDAMDSWYCFDSSGAQPCFQSRLSFQYFLGS